jgi:hypothetical protein
VGTCIVPDATEVPVSPNLDRARPWEPLPSRKRNDTQRAGAAFILVFLCPRVSYHGAFIQVVTSELAKNPTRVQV